MTSPKPWKRIRSHNVLTNRWITVRQDTVALPSGTLIDDYFVAELPHVAAVMPVTPDNEVVFVRQYRHAAAQVMLELPAGNFDPQKESAATAAIRELREETGYQAKDLELMGIWYDNPVKCSYETHVFLARDVVLVGGQVWDVTEDIEVVTVPLDAIPEAIASGTISVSGSIAALYVGLRRLAGDG